MIIRMIKTRFDMSTAGYYLTFVNCYFDTSGMFTRYYVNQQPSIFCSKFLVNSIGSICWGVSIRNNYMRLLDSVVRKCL